MMAAPARPALAESAQGGARGPGSKTPIRIWPYNVSGEPMLLVGELARKFDFANPHPTITGSQPGEFRTLPIQRFDEETRWLTRKRGEAGSCLPENLVQQPHSPGGKCCRSWARARWPIRLPKLDCCGQSTNAGPSGRPYRPSGALPTTNCWKRSSAAL